MSLSQFEAIHESAEELLAETSRIYDAGSSCVASIPCGELDGVLWAIKHSTLWLRRIKMSNEGCMGDSDCGPPVNSTMTRSEIRTQVLAMFAAAFFNEVNR